MRFDDRHEVVITGAWSTEMTHAVVSGVADRVVCNYALGFDEPDLRFLEYLPVKQVVILDPRITDIDPIYTLAPTLELLHLTVSPEVVLDLTALPRLSDLSAAWTQAADTIAAARRLQRVALGHYRPDDLTALAGIDALTSISMKDRPQIRSLAGLGQLPDLTHVGIYGASRLDDIADLRGRDRIQSLALQACPRLGTAEDLDGCLGLRKLNLAEGAELDTCGPLGGLTALQELYLYGTTRFVDGDLTPIAELPHLAELRMQNRRHYRPSVKDIQIMIDRRTR